MKFLLDVNVSARIAEALVAAGHDVDCAAHSKPVAVDADLLAEAVASERILITHDRDFSELVFLRRLQPPVGIVYLRFKPRDVGAALDRLLPLLDLGALKDHMTVIDPRRVRRTPFLVRSNDNG